MVSPFSEILGSNYAASDAEARQIGQIVSKQDSDIARIDEEIGRVQSILEQLQRDKIKMIASQRAHKALISPVRRTPPEIWAEIFVQCPPADEFVQINVLEAPLLLGQICRQWREIALSTQTLWNSIAVGQPLEPMSFSQMPLINAWLARSGNLPLFIKITYSDKVANSSANDFLDVFIPFSSRWLNLDLWLPQPQTEKMKNLSSLTGQLLVFETSVFVSQLILPYLRFPWAQLTEFRSSCIVETEDCYDIFRFCANLTHLSLRNIQDPADGSHRTLTTLPRLSWLELGSSSALGPLLDNLVVPTLHEIRLEATFSATWPKSQFMTLISRSSSPIEILAVDQVGIGREDVAECFEGIRTLREFTVVERWISTVYRRRAVQEDAADGGVVYEMSV